MNKKELLKKIGDISQIGGIRDVTYNDGRAKGVRAIELNTGVLSFTVLADRCLDIAQCFYKGEALSWISKAGMSGPWFYEKDGKSFLRNFFGGLVTTCGLKNIGRPTLEYGLHDRISNTPAQLISVGADWIDDEYIMCVSGEIRDASVFGNNIVIKRKIKTKLFSSEIILEDTIINEGFTDEKIALCYHCNFGYPLVDEGTKIMNGKECICEISSPSHCAEEECIPVTFTDDEPMPIIENDKLSVKFSYSSDTLDHFLLWKMTGESEYTIGFEPRTTNFGGENIDKNNEFVILKPFEEYKTNVKFEVEEK